MVNTARSSNVSILVRARRLISTLLSRVVDAEAVYLIDLCSDDPRQADRSTCLSVQPRLTGLRLMTLTLSNSLNNGGTRITALNRHACRLDDEASSTRRATIEIRFQSISLLSETRHLDQDHVTARSCRVTARKGGLRRDLTNGLVRRLRKTQAM